jgi:eukaryotic-like serine/threonine-protein kinase
MSNSIQATWTPGQQKASPEWQGGPGAGVSAPGDLHFCPYGGLHGASADARVSNATFNLLHRRLRLASWVLFTGFGLFLLWDVTIGLPSKAPPPASLRFAHILATVVALGVASYLTWLPQACFNRLRLLEGIVFGAAAGFFAYMQFINGVNDFTNGRVEMASAGGDASGGSSVITASFISKTVLPWIVLIQVYGIFIPNTWRRAALVTVLMALAPSAVSLLIATQCECVQSDLTGGGLALVMLWMVVPTAASIYGSHRVQALDDEVREAKNLGAYSLRRRLGAGGMGEVYLAEHRLLKRPAAIKLIKATQAGDPQAVARFESEVRTTAQLTHPNTVEIYDFGVTDDGTFFYVMEYLPGLDLQDLVDCYGPLEPSRAIYLLRQVCGALAEAHSRGVVHRDIKPGNIFSAQRGGLYDVAKLLDFGLVRNASLPPDAVRLTQQGSVVGSPLYTSPENVIGDGSPDRRSDVYSLGATAYFLLTGRPPFEGEQPIKVMFAHVNEPVTPIRDLNEAVPEGLAEVIQKCLAKRPIDRYQSVEEVDAALAECQQAGDWSIEKSRKWWARHEKKGASSTEGTDEVRLGVTQVGGRVADSAATQAVARDW